MHMYFLAIIAPEEINEYVLKWKLYFRDRYKCVAALRSPAHITLIPPFWMNIDLENELIETMNSFCKTQINFEIYLRNFNFFKPRVIFADVTKSDRLFGLHENLNLFIAEKKKFPIKSNDQIFHPHVTLATRDLTKKAFNEVWAIFANKKYEHKWNLNSVSLLRHNKKNWDVIYTSQFAN